MAFSLIQSQSGSVGAANASSVTVTTTATGAGHLLIAFVTVVGSSVTITPPSGWTQVGTTQGVQAGTASIALFYRENSPSGVTSHVFSFSASSNGAVAFEEWSGVALSSSLDQSIAQQNAKATATPTGTTAALAGTGELAVWGAGVQAASTLTYSSITNSYVWDSAASANSAQATQAEANLFYNTNVGSAATSSAATASGTGGAGNTTILAVFKAAASGTLNTRSVGMRTRVSTKRTQSTGLRTRVGTRHSWTTGLRLLVQTTPAYITIGGQLVTFDESTLKISPRLDERWRCQFTVLDYSGTAVFSYGQKVIFFDGTLGMLFSGFVATDSQDKSNTYPDPTIEHKIDCIDNRHLADKRTSNRLYTASTPAGKIVVDMLSDALAAEGVIAHYAVREDNTTAMWAAGTLVGTVAASNALALSQSGTDTTFTETTTANFAAGTLTNVTAASNALGLASFLAIKYSGSAGANLDNNNSLYAKRKIWAGTYTIASGDQVWFDVWIDSRSPEMKASLDLLYSDGTFVSVVDPTQLQDQWTIETAPSIDLAGWANDQWFSRTCIVGPNMVGKVIVAAYLVLQGQKGGDYTAYFKNCKITNAGGTTQRSFFSGADTAMHANVPASSIGYFNLAASVVTAYAATGSRISPARSLSPVGIVKGSVLSWEETDTVQPQGAGSSYLPQVQISASIDGGASWQVCTNNAPIPSLIAGMNTSGVSLLLQETLSVGGPNPSLSPLLDTCAFTVFSAPACTKTDFSDIDNTQTALGTGTLTNCTSYTDGLKTTGIYRGWTVTGSSDAPAYASQTVFGTGNPAQGEAENYFFLRCDASSECRSRFDFAGTWQNFIAEIDIHLAFNGSSAFGFTYRTTGWQNTNDTYAYMVDLNATSVRFGHGTNTASGAGGYTLITAPTINLTVGQWYRVKIIANGTTHAAYVNDVLIYSVTDATYTAAGNIGVREYNTTAARNSGHYDNFGIVGYESDLISVSSRVTPALALSGTVGDSRINWQASVPDTSVLLVESTLDGGTTWATCTNGTEIPSLVSGYNAAGKSVKFRFTMTNQATNLPIAITGYSAFVTGTYNATGRRVSPALSLAPVGRMGNSLVAWTAVLPSGATTVKVETSPDASTWTDVTGANGSPIPGILMQPDPTVDGFSTNTSANYTNTFGTGGSAATVTYTLASSYITLAGGSHAFYLNSTISVADIDLLCDLDMTDSGGLAWRFVDQNNYYTLTVADNQASIGTPNRFTLTRVAAGVSTTLATAVITFTRSMHHRVRVTMLGGVITASLSGTQLLTSTDASPLGAGKVGYSNNGGTLRTSQLWIAPQGSVTTGLNVYSRVTLGSTDPTAVSPQLVDLEVTAYDANIGAGALIPSADYRYTMIDQNVDDLAKQSNYAWYIDPNLLFHFGNRAAVPAPWILQSNSIGMPSSLEVDSNLLAEVSGDLYRNRQVITNVTNTVVFSNNFVGDGHRTSFTLDYPIAPGTVPAISLFGQAQTVGKKGTTGAQWYYAEGDATIAQDASGTVLGAFDTLSVSGTGTFNDTVVVNNTAAQAALALRAGNSGIVEAVEDATTNHPGGMLYPAAVVYANQLLTRYCVVDANNLPTGRSLTFKTYRNGLAVGQILSVFLPEENLYDVQLLITAIDIGMQTQSGNTVLYNYTVTATELPNVGSWAKLFASNFL